MLSYVKSGILSPITDGIQEGRKTGVRKIITMQEFL